MAIAQSILDQVQAIAEREGLGRVEAVHLRIGAMRAVVPEALEFGVEVLSQGTPLEGVRVMIEEIPIRLSCDCCGAVSSPDAGMAWLCPSCGSTAVTMSAGKELVLESLDVED